MMQGQHLFEYAVIRLVPQVEREEFLNIGVVLFCKGQKFLKVQYLLNKERVMAFSDKLDIPEIESYLCAFERICNGSKDSGAIGMLPVAERFRWLTATRSTVVQCSKVHPGLCDSPVEMLERLFTQMVL
jgi:hypothetical protein